jgi:hypothetical protein
MQQNSVANTSVSEINRALLCKFVKEHFLGHLWYTLCNYSPEVHQHIVANTNVGSSDSALLW